MKSSKLFIFSIIISLSFACENQCSGHGECQKQDKCECYPGWGAADCSQRACPFSESWTYSALGDLNHDGAVTTDSVLIQWNQSPVPESVTSKSDIHRYAECSNAGICNREKGECECFAGYTGAACQRKSCPTAVEGEVCSSHGRCLSTKNLLSKTANKYNYWEVDKEFSCVCDEGWSGITCNQRDCPRSFDPLQMDVQPVFMIGYKPDFQEHIHILRYKYDNVIYQSLPIVTRRTVTNRESNIYVPKTLDEAEKRDYAEEVRIAISVIPVLTQTRVEIGSEGTIKIQVDGLDPDKFLISSVVKDDISHISTGRIRSSVVETHECGNRGMCNHSTGTCECFNGFYGRACDMKRAAIQN